MPSRRSDEWRNRFRRVCPSISAAAVVGQWYSYDLRATSGRTLSWLLLMQSPRTTGYRSPRFVSPDHVTSLVAKFLEGTLSSYLPHCWNLRLGQRFSPWVLHLVPHTQIVLHIFFPRYKPPSTFSATAPLASSRLSSNGQKLMFGTIAPVSKFLSI